MALSTSGKTPTNISLPLQQKALKINGLLCKAYGAPFPFFSDKDPVSQLVSALLSHRTKNRVSGEAYHRLAAAFPNWQALIDAPVDRIEETIRMVTFPEVKAPRIQAALRFLAERTGLSLDFLQKMTVTEAQAWLEQIPGVGVKTSAAVLNFSRLRMPALVVDTHHFRVAERIGLIPPKSSLDKGARILAAYLPSDWDGQQVYDDHQAYMRHGQRVCHWSQPNCNHCLVREACDYFKRQEKRV
jgi:endonuclease-3